MGIRIYISFEGVNWTNVQEFELWSQECLWLYCCTRSTDAKWVAGEVTGINPRSHVTKVWRDRAEPSLLLKSGPLYDRIALTGQTNLNVRPTYKTTPILPLGQFWTSWVDAQHWWVVMAIHSYILYCEVVARSFTVNSPDRINAKYPKQAAHIIYSVGVWCRVLLDDLHPRLVVLWVDMYPESLAYSYNYVVPSAL